MDYLKVSITNSEYYYYAIDGYLKLPINNFHLFNLD